MADLDAAQLVAEILTALDTVGEVESWIDLRMDGSVDGTLLAETFRELTQTLLGAEPPKIAHWEHLLFAAAVRSSESSGQRGYEACKEAITKLSEMVEAGFFDNVAPDRIVTVASALTLVLTAQRKLHQSIEAAIVSLSERFTDILPEMAERCQDIWQRRGQMTGEEGLYVWDTRNSEWRLSQDFKPYRPTS